MEMHSRQQKKCSNFDLGMSEWTGNADEEIEALNAKKLHLSLSNKKKGDKENSERFSFINTTVAEQLESRYILLVLLPPQNGH